MPDRSDAATRLAQLWPPHDWHDLTVLVAVSGGPDSVALLRAMCAVRMPGAGRLIVAHYNHALRAQADDDEAFVLDLAASLGLECQVGRAGRPLGASPPASHSEESARRARYDFLLDRAMRLGARYVATAHTADDQAETVLHRIVRGTGLAGLAGMRRCRPLLHGVSLVRPLLRVRRADLLAYLQRLGQLCCEDATNSDVSFTRNRLRHELLPQLAADYNPHVVEALLRLARLAAEAQEVIAAEVEDLAPRCMREEAGRVVLDCDSIAGQPRHIVREVLMAGWRRQAWPEQSMGFKQWDELANLVLATEAGQPMLCATLSGGIRVWREGDRLVMVSTGETAA